MKKRYLRGRSCFVSTYNVADTLGGAARPPWVRTCNITVNKCEHQTTWLIILPIRLLSNKIVRRWMVLVFDHPPLGAVANPYLIFPLLLCYKNIMRFVLYHQMNRTLLNMITV